MGFSHSKKIMAERSLPEREIAGFQRPALSCIFLRIFCGGGMQNVAL